VGESRVVEARQANLILLWLLLVGASALTGYWVDKLDLNPFFYAASFIGCFAGIWLSHRLRVIPNMRKKYASLGFGAVLFAASIYSGSYLSGNAVIDIAECNPNYFPCVPDDYADLDCNEVDWRVDVIGTDVYNLDRDGDGIGCEWNPVFTPDETIEK
jgi:hypothetical protein